MPGDIAVNAIPLVQPAAATAAPEVQPPVAAATASSTKQTVANPNPSYQLDPSIGIVVIQFRSQAGKVELSIPSQQQLDAYAKDPASAFSNESDIVA